MQENEEDFVVILDSGEYAGALSWDGTYVSIRREGMDRLLEKYGVEGERFRLGFGGYSKIPKMEEAAWRWITGEKKRIYRYLIITPRRFFGSRW